MTARAGGSGMITARVYMAWRDQHYRDELRDLQASVEETVVVLLARPPSANSHASVVGYCRDRVMRSWHRPHVRSARR